MDNKKAVAAHEYKLLKEAFVSGFDGGSISEINQVTLVAPASVLLWSVLQSQQSFFTPYTPLALVVDFLLNCAAILFATTFYSSQPLLLNGLLAIPAIIITVSSKLNPPKRSAKGKKEKLVPPSQKDAVEKDPFPVKPFVTAYRGTMMVVTCVAILAVDFKVFPRRFAKVENWGTSLMDLGVGSFVFSAGTVAARPILKQQLSKASKSLFGRLRTAARHSAPLLVLGLIRLYSVKGLDYAEHVTEYGVHWNFFFTLCLIPPFVAIFDSAFSILPSYAALAILLGVVYEAVLDSTNLTGYILTAERTDLLSRNREGVFSLFGYLAIFLAGQGTGMYILPRKPQSRLADDPILRKLVIWSLVWCLMTFFAVSYNFGLNLSVSRRLANLPYFLWIAAFNTSQITLFYLVESAFLPDASNAKSKAQEQLQARQSSSWILRAFNKNGLAIFLIANLLTGVVNMTLPTLTMSNLEAVGVLLAYLATLTGIALTLDLYDISIKL